MFIRNADFLFPGAWPAQEHKLKLLSEQHMGEAVKEYVDKEEGGAIAQMINFELERTQVLSLFPFVF